VKCKVQFELCVN